MTDMLGIHEGDLIQMSQLLVGMVDESMPISPYGYAHEASRIQAYSPDQLLSAIWGREKPVFRGEQ
jgi:hypothetical protein